MFFTLLSMASLVAAQAPGISTNPGGIIPAGLTQPSTAGFMNPTVLPAHGGYAICVSGIVPVTASAQNVMLNLEMPANQSELSQTLVSYITDGSPFVQQLMGGVQSVSGTYNISASLCMPANGTMSDTVQFLTHGVGFDRYYWDWAPGYSYVDFAAVQGYATFSYDRLGVGQSSTPDPIRDVQAPLEVEIAAELIRMLRNGQFGGKNFTSVVGTGHSFGSGVTQGVTARYPALLDAAVLTGFSINRTGQPSFYMANNFAIASQNSPYRFTGLSNGYIVSASAISNQLAFFHSPDFDPSILAAVEAAKGTLTMGELFSTDAIIRPATNFTNPVAVVNGDADLPFCFGNCTYPINKAGFVRSALYPQARNITGGSVFIVPQTGHGINLHYSATQAYQIIQDFIKNSGL